MKPRTKRIVKTLGIVVLVLLALYVGSYLALSANGRYEPAAIGLNGVKSYGWAPYGFVKNYRWNSALIRTYLPLYAIDCNFWHTCDKACSGRYPINEVDSKDIWKVYKACGF